MNPEGGPYAVGVEIARDAGAVLEEVAEGGGAVFFVDVRSELGEQFRECRVKAEFAFIDEDADEGGGHGFGA